MKLLHDPQELSAIVGQWHSRGEKVALVPTMGWFHDGHLSLMRRGRQLADRVVTTLFVNPIQFGPSEDLAAYPRDLQRDCDLASGTGIDVLYAPAVADMYPPGFQTSIHVAGLGKGLCGASRPGHFDGVCTVVMKFLQQTRADLAIFGEKDFQQLAVIRRMVLDLNLPVEIIGHPTVREASGLAMSSRNSYLRADEMEAALCLHRAIVFARAQVASAREPLAAEDLRREIADRIRQTPGCVVDYVEIVDTVNLERCSTVDAASRLILAVKINDRVRLIDNAALIEPEQE